MKNIYFLDADSNLLASDQVSRDQASTLPMVVKYRVHVAACDGNFTKCFSSPEAAGAYCVSMGFGDGGVTDHGTARFDGVTLRTCESKFWYAVKSDVERRILNGWKPLDAKAGTEREFTQADADAGFIDPWAP